MTHKKLVVFALLMAAVLQSGAAQSTPSAKVSAELIAAETEMFAKITKQDPDFMQNLVASDYFSINADGSTNNKAQLMALKGTPQQQMMAAATYKEFDRQIRAYGNVGIVTGRTRAYMQDTYLVEFLWTAIFVKQHDKWMFTHWQGTISKDSPPPPPMPKG